MFGVISPRSRFVGGNQWKREYAASKSRCKCIKEVETQGWKGNDEEKMLEHIWYASTPKEAWDILAS